VTKYGPSEKSEKESKAYDKAEGAKREAAEREKARKEAERAAKAIALKKTMCEP
jgi:ABC-type oligopeptide transport system substrate-binding subunit